MTTIYYYAIKYLITAVIVVLVSELVKYSGKLGAFVAALPTVTILTLIWLYVEGQSHDKIANHAWYTLWYVIPTLPMFIVFPYLYNRFSFWMALTFSGMLTILCFGLFVILMRRLGIDLI